jgi:hypothetical protein
MTFVGTEVLVSAYCLYVPMACEDNQNGPAEHL